MLKAIAIIGGGLWLYSKLQEKASLEAGTVVPVETYPSVESMPDTDYQITIDKLIERASAILDPAKRQEMIESIYTWVNAGLSELQIREYIDNAASLFDQVAAYEPETLEPDIVTTDPVAVQVITPAPQNVLMSEAEVEARILPTIMSAMPFVEGPPEDPAQTKYTNPLQSFLARAGIL
jgi:hypothetical protein